jgi:hypothetical protein
MPVLLEDLPRAETPQGRWLMRWMITASMIFILLFATGCPACAQTKATSASHMSNLDRAIAFAA